MAGVHFFPRYSSKENAVTNNVLLLLSRVHAMSPELLETLLEQAAEGVTLSMGPSFEQQVRGSESVPDGLVRQGSFKIVLETKLGAQVGVSQLRRHLEAFGEEDAKVLLVVTSGPIEEQLRSNVQEEIRKHNVNHSSPVVDAWLTFQDFISLIRDLASDRDYEIEELVAEFESYCEHEGLLPRSHFRLRAVPCGKSFQENMKFGVYYEPPGRTATSYEFLGIYRHKAIRGIGRVANCIRANIEGEDIRVIECTSPATEEQLDRIRGIVHEAREARGWDLRRGHEFVVLESVHETLFRKTTPGGIRSTRYLDLGRIMKRELLPSVAQLAGELKEVSWEGERLG